MTPGYLRIRSCIPQKHPPASTARSVDGVIYASVAFLVINNIGSAGPPRSFPPPAVNDGIGRLVETAQRSGARKCPTAGVITCSPNHKFSRRVADEMACTDWSTADDGAAASQPGAFG